MKYNSTNDGLVERSDGSRTSAPKEEQHEVKIGGFFMVVLEDNYRYSNQFQREKIQLSPDTFPKAGWLAPF